MGGGGNPFKGNPLKKIEKELKRGIDKPQNLLPYTGIPFGPDIGIIDEIVVEPIQKEKQKIKDELKRREDEQKNIEDEIDKEKERRDEQAGEKGKQARSAVRKLARARRRSTILTSGLGVPGEPEVAGKTLLGR